MSLSKQIGRSLKIVRDDKKFSQAQMGDVFNKSASWYSKVEQGLIDLSVSQLENIADKLNLPVSEFIECAENNTNISIQENNGIGVMQNSSITIPYKDLKKFLKSISKEKQSKNKTDDK